MEFGERVATEAACLDYLAPRAGRKGSSVLRVAGHAWVLERRQTSLTVGCGSSRPGRSPHSRTFYASGRGAERAIGGRGRHGSRSRAQPASEPDRAATEGIRALSIARTTKSDVTVRDSSDSTSGSPASTRRRLGSFARHWRRKMGPSNGPRMPSSRIELGRERPWPRNPGPWLNCERWCAEEDSNLHGGIPPQGPQPCASTNSATGAGAPEYRPLDSVRRPR